MFAKLLGVWLQDDLGFRKHVYYVTHICNQRTYLITQLKRQGLPIAQMQKVFSAIILARVLYAAPAWRGYLTSSEINCLQHFLDKAKLWNITASSYNIEDLFDECDIVLFKSSLNVTHCLNHLYPIKQHHTHFMTLRPRGHNFTLLKLRYQTGRNSFINRSFYKYV